MAERGKQRRKSHSHVKNYNGAFIVFVACFAAACAATEQGSIGVMLVRNHANGRVSIRTVPPGTGQRAGLEPGDEIVAIEGKPVSGFSSDEEIRKALRGDVGTKVKLTVLREGARREIEVERGGRLEEK